MKIPMWLKVMGGLFILWLSLFIFTSNSRAGTLYSEDFSGSAGAVDDWNIWTSSGSSDLVRDGSGGGVLTGAGYNGWLGYDGAGASSWSDYTEYITVYDLGLNRVDIAVRANKISTTDIRFIYVYGYGSSFTCIYDNGPAFVSLGLKSAGVTIGSGDQIGIRVVGSYPEINLTVLKNGVPTNSTWTFNPGNTNLDTGGPAFFKEYSGDWRIDDYLILDYPETTPTFTATDTPTITPTYTITPTHTPTHTPTNTPTASPVYTPTSTATPYIIADDMHIFIIDNVRRINEIDNNRRDFKIDNKRRELE